MVSSVRPKAGWKVRRSIIITTLIFCALVIGKLTLFGPATSLSETLALGAFGLSGSVIGAYVFGAVWDDQNERKAQVEKPEITEGD